jgi:PAS domain S-box-containing protein
LGDRIKELGETPTRAAETVTVTGRPTRNTPGDSGLRLRPIRARLVSALLRPTAPSRALGLVFAGVLIAVETLLVCLLKRVAPMDAFGVVYLLGVLVIAMRWGFGLAAVTSVVSAFAFGYLRSWPNTNLLLSEAENWAVIIVFLIVALSANSLADLARSRAAEADQRRAEADLAAELAHLMLRAGDLTSALDAAAQRIAQVLELPSAALKLETAAADERRSAIPLRDGATVLGTLLVGADVPKQTQQRLRDRVVPALEALLASARQRQAIHDALEDSRKELERFFDLSSDLLGIGGPPAYWKRINHAFERTFGYSSQELLARSFLDFVHPNDLGVVRKVLGEVQQSRGRTQFEHRIISRDGSVRWLDWNVVPDRGLLYVAGRDVTERRREQDRLRKAHRMVEASRDELSALAAQQSALRLVATLVARGVAPAEVFNAVAAELARCLDVENAGLFRYEPDGTATLLAGQDEPDVTKTPPGTRFSLKGDNVAAMVLRSGRVARIDDYDNAAGFAAARMRALGVRSAVGAPIIVGGRVWGVALVGSPRPEPLPPDTEARVGDFADLVATAIANAQTRTELTASRTRIVAAADNARRRLERDLHDGAQQRLVSLGLELRMAEFSVPPELDGLKGQITNVVQGLAGISQDLQEISRGIHPAILSKGGLGPALKTLARRSAVPVNLDMGAIRRVPEHAEVAVYYVVAEALTNAAKHAQASEVTVGVTAQNESLHVAIRDDGVGGADPGKGSGLVGLMDRVEALGGEIQITSHAGKGTSLLVEIPLKAG